MFETARKIQRRRQADGEGGFTLIELLIVIVVLGILAAIVVFALGGVTGQSAVAACNSDAKTVSVAVSAWQAENPGIAPTQSYLTGATAPTGVATQAYLKSWPSNPTYYTITLDGTVAGNVMVALNANDPGYTATVPITTAKQYDGTGAFTYSGETSNPTFNGQNICAGA